MKQEELLNLKTEIENTKIEVANLTGQKKEQLKTLKEKFNCNSINDAETKYNKLQSDINKLSEQIETKTTELKEQYPELVN